MVQKKFGPDSEYRPRYCKMLIDHMDLGFTFSSFSAVIGISHTTLSRWAQQFKELQIAREIGEQRRSLKFQTDLINATEGKTKASAKAIAFALKNADPDNFKEKLEIDNNNAVPFIIDTGIMRQEIMNDMARRSAIEAESREIVPTKELPPVEVEVEEVDEEETDEEEIVW